MNLLRDALYNMDSFCYKPEDVEFVGTPDASCSWKEFAEFASNITYNRKPWFYIDIMFKDGRWLSLEDTVGDSMVWNLCSKPKHADITLTREILVRRG